MKAVALLLALAIVNASTGAVVVDYNIAAGGSNSNPLNGLSARATFTTSANALTILLENTSTGVPAGFDVADSLLTSIAFNLPGMTMAGVSALIGPGSHGLGAWSSLVAGSSVGEQWKWTNAGGGDLLEPFAQVISTSQGSVAGGGTRFSGGSGTVGGPFGGIAAATPIVSIPGAQQAVAGSIVFTLTLSGTLSDSQLLTLANASLVEFGSDRQYLSGNPVPAPGAALLGLIGIAAAERFRRRLA